MQAKVSMNTTTDMQKLDRCAVNLQKKTITLPHLGLTTRVILAAASEVAWEGIEELPDEEKKRRYNWRPKFSLMYKRVCIGQIYLKSLGQYQGGQSDQDLRTL